MEDYINDYTLIEDGYYKVFKDSVECPLCLGILINPVMCMNCQNSYCKKCVDSWSKKDDKCPNRCNNPNYQRSISKNEILSKLKFKCNGCKKEIQYENVKNHKNICCSEILNTYEIIDLPEELKTPKRSNTFSTPKSSNTLNEYNTPFCTFSSKIQRLTKEEISELKKSGKFISYITSK